MSEGIRFPFRVSGEHGRVEASGGRENIRESIGIILTTEPGERITRPEFGARLHQFLFEVMDSRLEEMIDREVVHALDLWEERITDVSVRADFEGMAEGVLRLEVSYTIVETGEEDTVSVGLER